MSEYEKKKHFTSFPNVVFDAYSDLTKEEKFLYGELRRHFWDMKTHIHSLEELNELTRYSKGALSKMLPNLDKVELVQAGQGKEKSKNGKEKGWKKYHITLVDIWWLNELFYELPEEEQRRLAALPGAQFVHEMNNLSSRKHQTVHEMNNLSSRKSQSSNRSRNEQNCSPNERFHSPNERFRAQNEPKDIKDKEDNSVSADADDTSPTLSYQKGDTPDPSSLPGRKERSNEGTNPGKGPGANRPRRGKQLTERGGHVLQLYQQYKDRDVTPTENDIDYINKLADAITEDQDFLEMLKEIDRDKYIQDRNVPIGFKFLWDNHNKYLDLVYRNRPKTAATGRTATYDESSFVRDYRPKSLAKPNNRSFVNRTASR